MAEITDYLQALTIGGNASSMTGKTEDGFIAGGFSAFVQALTGQPPTLVQLPNNKAKIILSEKQVIIMRKWLDMQLFNFKAPKDQSLSIEMNPVVVPWALKYAIPAALAFVILGWVGHYYLAR
jgi:hypothetical protein